MGDIQSGSPQWEHLAVLLGRASRHAMDRYERELAALGLTTMEATVLGMLGRAPASINELAAMWEVHASMMSRVVERLVVRDLATRREDPRDRRRLIVAVTEAGETAGKLAVEAGAQLNRTMTAGLAEEQVATLKMALRHMITALVRDEEEGE